MLGNGIYVTASMFKVKVAELDPRARASSLTNVRSGPQSPESHLRHLPARLALTIYKSTSVVTSASYHVSGFPQFCFVTRSSLNEISPPPSVLSVCLSFYFLTSIHFHSSFLLYVHVLYTRTVYIYSASCYGGVAVATNTACCNELFEFDISYY